MTEKSTHIDEYPARRPVNSQPREHQHMAEIFLGDSCKHPGDKKTHASQTVLSPTSLLFIGQIRLKPRESDIWVTPNQHHSQRGEAVHELNVEFMLNVNVVGPNVRL